MHGCESEGKIRIHELPQEQVKRELEDGRFSKFKLCGTAAKTGKELGQI